MSTSAPRTVVVERVIGGMAEVPKPRRAIRSCWWRLARGGDQRRWGTQAPDRVAVYRGPEHGVCRRPKKTACVAEKKDCDVRAEMRHAKVVASGREAVVAAMAMKTTAAAESPATASQD
jgi:hypothetical protein